LLLPVLNFFLGFLAFSLLAICPGFFFRSHYFVLLLPAVALLSGCATGPISRMLPDKTPLAARKAAPLAIVFIVVLQAVLTQRNVLFVQSPSMVSRTIYGTNPFPESLEIAKYIRENSLQNDRIAVIGSEPQIYFYSRRRSVTPYVYTYEMMKGHAYARQMQQEMIDDIERACPKFLIVVNISTSLSSRPESEQLIFEWLKKYPRENYDAMGIVDILSADHTEYRWDNDVAGYSPQSCWLGIFRRKGPLL